MGSPLALFSLITIIGSSQGGSTHDITPNLEELFSRLIINEQKMPWLNFTHPGDPIAYPLEKVLPNLVDPQHKFIDLEDVLTSGSGWLEFISRPLAGSFLSLMNGGSNKIRQNRTTVVKTAAQMYRGYTKNLDGRQF